MDRALEVISSIAPPPEEISLGDIPGLRLLLDQAKILARAGRLSNIEALRRRVEVLQPSGSREGNIKSQVVDLLVQTCVEIPIERVNSPALHIQDYSRWTLNAVTPVSKHSVRPLGANPMPAAAVAALLLPTLLLPIPHAAQGLRFEPHNVRQAIYHFRTGDASRGTPIRKGRGGRTVWSKTWHTTLLAEVGEVANKEGP